MQYRIVMLVGALVFFAFSLARIGIKIFSQPAAREAVSASIPSSVPSSPIKCDETTYDFGAKLIGESVEHEFQLRNLGDRDVEIVDVRPGCSCTTTVLQEKVIKPKQSVPLKVAVSLADRRGDVEFHIVVVTKDRDQASLVLIIKGIANSEFTLTPHVINFDTPRQGDQLEGFVDIKSTGETPFTLTDVHCESPLCRVSHETIKSGREYRVTIQTIDQLPVGFWKTAIRIRTDNLKEAQVHVPVVAQIKPVPHVPNK